MRLDKYLSNMGKGSRSEVKHYITRGRVLVNGEIVKKVNHNIDPDKDHIILDGMMVGYEDKVYLMMNKPKGVISATEDKHHKTVIDLLKHQYGNRKLFPVGRLDIDTEGMLLITDDGAFNHALMAPKKHVEKKYYVTIEGTLHPDMIDEFEKGMVLEDDTVCKPAQLKILDDTHCHVILSEGKYHQVKRMLEMVECTVIELERVQIGQVNLDTSLARGDFRKLTDDELKKLYK